MCIRCGCCNGLRNSWRTGHPVIMGTETQTNEYMCGPHSTRATHMVWHCLHQLKAMIRPQGVFEGVRMCERVGGGERR